MTPEQKQQLTAFLFDAAIVIGPLLVGWIGVMFKLSIARREALQAVAIAVGTVRQTYVDDIKKASADGDLTQAEKDQAKKHAIEVALAVATPAAQKVIAAWTTEQRDAIIESFVSVSKT